MINKWMKEKMEGRADGRGSKWRREKMEEGKMEDHMVGGGAMGGGGGYTHHAVGQLSRYTVQLALIRNVL